MPGFSAPARLTFASPGGGSPTPRVLVKVNRSIRRTSRALADTQLAVWEHLTLVVTENTTFSAGWRDALNLDLAHETQETQRT